MLPPTLYGRPDRIGAFDAFGFDSEAALSPVERCSNLASGPNCSARGLGSPLKGPTISGVTTRRPASSSAMRHVWMHRASGDVTCGRGREGVSGTAGGAGVKARHGR
eukprot:1195236-Prorocentrum_minimum.AAC.4